MAMMIVMVTMMMMITMIVTRRKVTACLPGLARACAVVPVVLQLASRRKAVCRRGWTRMETAASSWIMMLMAV